MAEASRQRARRSAWVAVAVVVGALAGAGCDWLKKTPEGGPTPGASASASGAASTALASYAAWEPAARKQAEEEGRAVLVKHQCWRCHEIEDIKPKNKEEERQQQPLHCISCHTFLEGLKPGDRQFKEINETNGEGLMERYQRNIVHLKRVPNLTGIARRVRADWLRDFLREPYDVRPGLEESMIRHRLDEGEIRAVVRYFAAMAPAADPYAPGYQPPALPPKPTAARVEEGKKLFVGRGCPSCHAFGNLDMGIPPGQLKTSGEAASLAPNLRFVRDRTHPEVLIDWLRDPQRVSPGTLMPPMNLSRDEATLVRDFMLGADPGLDARPLPEPQLPPAVNRAVPYEEMKEAVLGKVCVHCHMNDHEKDLGPGQGGGFGYAGVKLAMRTYEALVAGAVDAKGQRYSVLVPRPGEAVPSILASMLKRRVEEGRDHVEPGHDHERPHYPAGAPGMPMGLPSMSDEQFGILRAWIEQGCQGPTRVTGRDYVTRKGVKEAMRDGFLVPDGPLKKNRGCEVRAPEQPRPAWSYEHNAAALGSAAPGGSAPSASASPASSRPAPRAP